jgi:chromosome segregation ATPase
MTLLEEDKNYHEENYKRANAELMNIRSQYNLLQDENSSFSEQLYRKNQELSKLQFSLQTLEGQVNDYGQKDEELYKIRNEMFAMRTGNSALED